jgi:hypothetical protein
VAVLATDDFFFLKAFSPATRAMTIPAMIEPTATKTWTFPRPKPPLDHFIAGGCVPWVQGNGGVAGRREIRLAVGNDCGVAMCDTLSEGRPAEDHCVASSLLMCPSYPAVLNRLGGTLGAIVTCPLEMIKTRLQVRTLGAVAPSPGSALCPASISPA